MFLADGGFSARSGFTAGSPGTFGQEAEIYGVPLEFRSDDESVLLYLGLAYYRVTGRA